MSFSSKVSVWPLLPIAAAAAFPSPLTLFVMFAARTVSRLSRAAKNQQTVVSGDEQRQTDEAGQTD